MSKKIISAIIPFIIGISVFFLLTSVANVLPDMKLSFNAILYTSIFVAVVVALVLEPIPATVVGLIGITLCAALGIVGDSPKANRAWALSGFSNGVIWLVFAAFMFAKGYEKTGLGKRLALILIKMLGKRTLTLGYAVALSDFILAPFIPSNTARSAGTIFPIVKNIPPIYGSTPEQNPRKMGAYISWVGIASTCVTSSLFLTGLAPNLLAVSMINKTLDTTVTWGAWFAAAAVPFLILFLLVPIVTYLIYPPEVKASVDIPKWAKNQLSKMGAISKKEITMLCLSLIALLLWLFGSKLLNSTTVALVVLSLMILLNVINLDDLIENKAAWKVLIWFATLVALAGGLKKVGFLKWLALLVSSNLSGLSPLLVIISLILIFFLMHYFFASVTAHTVALLPIMLTTIQALLPADMLMPAAMGLVLTLGIMGILTPYATGPSPIWYGYGCIKPSEYWRLGAIFGAMFIGVFLLYQWIIL